MNLTNFRKELVEIYAADPPDIVRLQQSCDRYHSETRFQDERVRVENAAAKIHGVMNSAGSPAAEVAAALAFLRRARHPRDGFELYHDLFVKGYKREWSSEQQAYFENSYEKLKLNDFFFSFTTRCEEPAGRNPVNTVYKYFILKMVTPEDWRAADRNKENLLAKAVYFLLRQCHGHKGFYYPDSQFDNAITEDKLDENLANALVLVQLVQNVMFRSPEKGKNYCFYEFDKMRARLAITQEVEHRILFVVAERDRDAFVPLAKVHPEYKDWHTAVYTRDPPYIPEVATRARSDAQFLEIRQLIKKIADQIEVVWNRLEDEVPA